MSKLHMIAAVNEALKNITKVVKYRELQFHPYYEALKIVRRGGENVLRLRFHVDQPLVKKLVALNAGFTWLKSQHDYND